MQKRIFDQQNSKAYETLTNEQKRASYDASGFADAGTEHQHRKSDFEFNFDQFFKDFDEFFKTKDDPTKRQKRTTFDFDDIFEGMENEENEIFRTFLGEDFFGGLDLGSMGMKMGGFGGKKFKMKTSTTVTRDGKTETRSFSKDSQSNVKISKVPQGITLPFEINSKIISHRRILDPLRLTVNISQQKSLRAISSENMYAKKMNCNLQVANLLR